MRSRYADKPEEFTVKREEIVPRSLEHLLLADDPQGRKRTRRRRPRKAPAVRRRA
ncbi:hypothetical protein ACQP1W_51820 [Spirillospora sp. CA-255316]